MSIYALKTRFQALLRPMVRWLHARGVTANQVTVAACVVSVALGAFLIRTPRPWLALLPVWMLLRMALNAIDGMLAREFGQKSALGAYLNELTDVISDAFLYLPFAYLPAFDPLWIAAVIVLAVISEMAGVLAVMVGSGRRYDGPMGKSDRAFVFGAMALWIALGGKPAPWLAWLFPRLLVLLLLATIFNRVRE